MYKTAQPFFLICETPLHVGCGSGLGVVDLPIQREKHTDFPKVESGGLKGSLRESFEDRQVDATKIHLAFGYDPKSADQKVQDAIAAKDREYSGALGFTDARLLLFPVRSAKGLFAWTTCPWVLERFVKDMALAERPWPLKVPPDESVPAGSPLLIKQADTSTIILEEYSISVQECETATKWAKELADLLYPARNNADDTLKFWREKLATNLAILPDDLFRDLVQLSTEVVTRVKIDNATGTVQRGALFTEEYLPSDSVLYALALSSPVYGKSNVTNFSTDGEVSFFFTGNLPPIFQLGGNATIGKGLVRTAKLS